jgi:hypothetical protein
MLYVAGGVHGCERGGRGCGTDRHRPLRQHRPQDCRQLRRLGHQTSGACQKEVVASEQNTFGNACVTNYDIVLMSFLLINITVIFLYNLSTSEVVKPDHFVTRFC